MRTLVFITAHFPFGNGETFINSEYPYLVRSFDKIIIIAQDFSGQQTRKTDDNTLIYRYNPATSFTGFLRLPFQLLINAGEIVRMVKDETVYRKSNKDELNVKRAFILFRKTIKAIQLKEFITGKLRKEISEDPVVLYSYWLKTGAHAIAMMNKKHYLRISRGHGSDIYEEKTESKYLPLLKFTATELDALVFISENGRKYFEKKIGISRPEFYVSYLGVIGPDKLNNTLLENDQFTIVSCSNMIPLKRIDMIIRSLELLETEKKIQWLHFGDGRLRKEIEKLAAEKLEGKRNISFRFMGFFANEDLLKFYSLNRIDLFLNTSSSEGLPVSIMEAQSYGIPVIATDIGGVCEIVTEGTGHLLQNDFEPADLKELIIFYIDLDEEKREAIRIKAYNNWKQKFSSETNYSNFTATIRDLYNSRKYN